jgi:hypothetical protein
VSADARGQGIHLLPVGEVFRQGYGGSTFLAVCGEPVLSKPNGDDVNLTYCLDCVRAVLAQVSAEVDPCPGCGATSDVKVITGTSPRVQAGKCGACGTEWAVTVGQPTLVLGAPRRHGGSRRGAVRAASTPHPRRRRADTHRRGTAIPADGLSWPHGHEVPVTAVDDPHVAAVERLVELAKQRGFTFTPAGEQGSLWGERVAPGRIDVVFLGDSGHCNAVRSRRGHLAPGEPLFTERITGPALSVLHTVLHTWPPPT